MGLLSRLTNGRIGARGRSADDGLAHLRAWAASHEGVEGFVEPRTTVTETTLLLVDKHGAWTRRRVAGPSRVE